MKVKLKRILEIGVWNNTVKLVKDLKSDEGFRACIHFRKKVIQVDPALSDVQRLTSLMHEVVHQIDENYQCDLSEGNTSRIANGLSEFLIRYLEIEFDWSDIEEE